MPATGLASQQSSDMAALLQAAELLRLEEEGNLDPQTLERYGLTPNSFPPRPASRNSDQRCMLGGVRYRA